MIPPLQYSKIQTLQGEWEMREEPWVYTELSAELMLHPFSPAALISGVFSHVLADRLSLCSPGTRLRDHGWI